MYVYLFFQTMVTCMTSTTQIPATNSILKADELCKVKTSRGRLVGKEMKKRRNDETLRRKHSKVWLLRRKVEWKGKHCAQIRKTQSDQCALTVAHLSFDQNDKISVWEKWGCVEDVTRIVLDKMQIGREKLWISRCRDYIFIELRSERRSTKCGCNILFERGLGKKISFNHLKAEILEV